MRIIARKTIKDYVDKNPSAKIALYECYYVMSSNDFDSLPALKRRFPSADYIGNDRYVFNIKGNHVRLICILFFQSAKVYIRFIGNHSEYDRIDAKNI